MYFKIELLCKLLAANHSCLAEIVFSSNINLLIVVFPTRTDNPRRPRKEYPNLPVFIHTVENANL
jgi:hypothetical protein